MCREVEVFVSDHAVKCFIDRLEFVQHHAPHSAAFAQKCGKKRGLARAAKMTEEERSASARKAARGQVAAK
jgi:hypothetical protein